MNIYCDNYAACNAMLVDRTAEQARVKGWHIWSGQVMGGDVRTVVLCPRCVDQGRRGLPAAPLVLEGQLELDL